MYKRQLLGNAAVTPVVCLVVCLTIMFVVVFAKCVGCSLPLLAEKIGLDPAVMASPFITTIVDATSLLILSLIHIFAVILVGCFNEKISLSGAWDGFRIIFAGIFSTGRNAAGELTWGFNAVNTGDMLFRATPLIMTGLSVAVAFKTGLFNIGAPGQYLISTMATLMIALSIPSSSVPTWILWILAFLGGCLAGALWGALPGLAKACLLYTSERLMTSSSSRDTSSTALPQPRSATN